MSSGTSFIVTLQACITQLCLLMSQFASQHCAALHLHVLLQLTQVPQLQVQEIVRQVPVAIPQEIVRQVAVPQIQTVEKIVEVPQVQTYEVIQAGRILYNYEVFTLCSYSVCLQHVNCLNAVTK